LVVAPVASEWQAVVVPSEQLSAVTVVSTFIDCINRGDIDGLSVLMTDDHTLQVLDEAPLVGRLANVEAWRGYASAFPHYVIYPHEFCERGDAVAVLGHTTGSHLGLPDDEEQELTVIWFALVDRGRLSLWQIFEDDASRRREFGLVG
jgi:hypothetical protein